MAKPDSRETMVQPSKAPRLLQQQVATIDPFPRVKAGKASKGQAGAYEVTRRAAGRNQGPGMVETLMEEEGMHSTSGQVVNMAGSKGFIDSLSEQTRRQQEMLSHDVVDAYRQGREKQLDIAKRRRELDAPFSTPDPPSWTSTSHATHVNLLPAVDRSTLDYILTKPRPKAKGDSQAKQPKGGTTYANEFLQRSQAISDVDALQRFHREALDSSRKAVAKKPGWIGGCPTTTYKTNHASWEVEKCAGQMHPNATEPVALGSFKATEEDEEYVQAVRRRRDEVHLSEDFATTNATAFKDRSQEGEKAVYTRSHFFDLQNGTLQMPSRGNAPLRKEDNYHSVGNTSLINPSQFVTSKMLHEQMALSGVVA